MTNSGWQLGNLSHVVTLSSNVFASIDILALKGFAHKRAATWQLESWRLLAHKRAATWQLESWRLFAHKRAATWQLGSCCHVVGCAFLKKDWQLEKWVGKSMLPCCRLCFS